MVGPSEKKKIHGAVLHNGEGWTHLQTVTRAVFDRESRHIATSGAEGTVRIWTVEECQHLLTIEVDPCAKKQIRVSALNFNYDGRFVMTGDWGSNLKVFDVKNGKLALQFEQAHSGKVTSAVFRSDNKLLLSGSEDKLCRIFDPRTKSSGAGGAMAQYRAPDEVLDVQFTPDGHGVLAALKSQGIRMWDARKGDAPVMTYGGNEDWVNSITISADGKTLLSGGSDKMMKLWDMTTGKCKQTLGPHEESVNCARFYGELFVCAQGNRFWESSKNSLVFWDPASGEKVNEVEGHSDAINWVDANGSTGRLVTAGMDRTARLWEVASKKEKKKKESPTPARKMSCANGCGKELVSALVQEHLNRECPLRDLVCRLCSESLKARDLQQHEQKECPNRPVTCDCGQTMPLSEQDNHNQTSCRMRKIECEWCGMPVRAEDIAEHQAKICQEREVLCSKGCGMRICASQILEHQTSVCKQRSVECDQCGMSFIFKDESAHRKKYCMGRTVECNLCSMKMTAMVLDMHTRRECVRRNVPCTLACGMLVPYEELPEHTSSHCHRRPVPCKWANEGCEDQIPFNDVEKHDLVCAFRPRTPEPEVSASSTSQPRSRRNSLTPSWTQDRTHPEYYGPECITCGSRQKACKSCLSDYCISCLAKSGLPSRGLCKTCTQKELSKLKKNTSSLKPLRF